MGNYLHFLFTPYLFNTYYVSACCWARGIESWKNPRVCLEGVQSRAMAMVTEADAQSSRGTEVGEGSVPWGQVGEGFAGEVASDLSLER